METRRRLAAELLHHRPVECGQLGVDSATASTGGTFARRRDQLSRGNAVESSSLDRRRNAGFPSQRIPRRCHEVVHWVPQRTLKILFGGLEFCRRIKEPAEQASFAR